MTTKMLMEEGEFWCKHRCVVFSIDAVNGQDIELMYSIAARRMRKNMVGNIFEQPHLFLNFEKFPTIIIVKMPLIFSTTE